MCSDEIPIGSVGEQRIDMLEATGLVRPTQRQIFSIPDTRHQLNTEEVGQREYGRILSLCVGMESGRLYFTFVFEQAIKNVDGFPGSGAKQIWFRRTGIMDRDVRIGIGAANVQGTALRSRSHRGVRAMVSQL
jgi:hypothetical protein